MDKQISLKILMIISGAVIVLTTVLIVFGVYGGIPGSKKLKLTVGKASLDVHVDNDSLDISTTLEDLLSQKKTSNEIKGILNGNGYYFFSDEALSLKIEKLSPDNGLSKKIVMMVKNQEGFFKKLPRLYQLDDSKLLDDIKTMKANHPLAIGLRRLASENAPPFPKDSHKVYVSFPGSIPDGHAAVCVTTAFSNRDLVIYTDAPSYRMIFVKADLKLPCNASVVSYDTVGREMNLIQISHEMGRRLFECQPFDKTMKVNVEVLKPGDEKHYPNLSETVQCNQEIS